MDHHWNLWMYSVMARIVSCCQTHIYFFAAEEGLAVVVVDESEGW